MQNLFLISAISMLALGAAFSLVLAIAHKMLHVEVDEKVSRIEAILPGINCGACGAASCLDFAEKVVQESVPANGCIAGGDDVGGQVAGIMGVDAASVAKKIAVIRCGATQEQRAQKAVYAGVQSCAASQQVMAGANACAYGCMGFGDCKAACPFGAIIMRDGLPIVLPEKCTACGNCIKACPRGLVTLMPYNATNGVTAVLCSSPAAAKEVRSICPVGCIGCGICAKFTPNGEFEVTNSLSQVNYDKVTEDTAFDVVRGKCPTNSIVQIIQESSGAVCWQAKERKELFNE